MSVSCFRACQGLNHLTPTRLQGEVLPRSATSCPQRSAESCSSRRSLSGKPRNNNSFNSSSSSSFKLWLMTLLWLTPPALASSHTLLDIPSRPLWIPPTPMLARYCYPPLRLSPPWPMNRLLPSVLSQTWD